ncbi:MAG: hypothetical protein R3F60_26365 [bacterium]
MLALLIALLATPVPVRGPRPRRDARRRGRGLRFFNTRLDLLRLFPTVERADGSRTSLKLEAEGTQGWQWVAVADSPAG